MFHESLLATNLFVYKDVFTVSNNRFIYEIRIANVIYLIYYIYIYIYYSIYVSLVLLLTLVNKN